MLTQYADMTGLLRPARNAPPWLRVNEKDSLAEMTPRRRASCALVIALVIAVAMTTGCSAGTAHSAGNRSGSTGNPGNSASTSGPAGMVQLGCGVYCMQAGGYGGGGDPPNMTRLLTTIVTALPDGIVPITVKCLFRQPCLGAILLGSADTSTEFACMKPAIAGSKVIWWGQSDLDVRAKMTRTFGVRLSSCAFGLLAKRGRLRVSVAVDSGQTLAFLSPADRKGLSPVGGGIITVSAP